MVIKAAAGALEYLPVYRVTNLADALARLKEAGLAIVGTAADSPQTIYDTDLTQPLALVIGSEDKGLRPRVRKQCDLVASIPMAAPEIGSLNAATSGGRGPLRGPAAATHGRQPEIEPLVTVGQALPGRASHLRRADHQLVVLGLTINVTRKSWSFTPLF